MVTGVLFLTNEYSNLMEKVVFRKMTSSGSSTYQGKYKGIQRMNRIGTTDTIQKNIP
ncbi:hypothetical protein SacN8_02025 [Sulfolobus acidocaldarius N8]|uniref:Uncharacterized protein n=2 Tax=Sulfolobus acidocaldarius TaxID=2285 RepID=M1JA98_9CREN|nr:hypothetical protein SacN8_02025 [Sulfolobus acidocaldarius N8]AGE72660.1 hypothetical protein SacRon12I_02020 [Sulfolobus acidocaldarius Ron12/I]